jgi:hypothetical protein
MTLQLGRYQLPREMMAKTKLAEAEYFFSAVKRTLHDPDKLCYNLSAFLSAWRSVPDVMLYDFAWRYSLGFTEEDRLTPHEFRIAARLLKRLQALEFLEWWNRRCEKIRTSPPPVTSRRPSSFEVMCVVPLVRAPRIELSF